jgi:pimeloyl-ACP methyl ester carboxylesterase
MPRRRTHPMRVVAMFAAVTGVAALLVLGEGHGRAAELPHLTSGHPCWFTGFTCGTLSVPLDHSGRVAGRLDLPVAVADSPPVPRRGFLLVLVPGQPGVQFATRMAGKLAPVLREYRLVLYDERGTGGGALQCPQLQAQMGSSLLRPPTAGAVRSCAAAIGTRRQFYGTDDVVADMELLRRALNADRWTLDGISYGSYVAERYAIAHPSRVRRLVLDSVVPHDGSVQLLAPSMRRAQRSCVSRAAAARGASATRPTTSPQSCVYVTTAPRYSTRWSTSAFGSTGPTGRRSTCHGCSTKHGSETATDSTSCSRQRRGPTRSRPMT